MRRRTFLKGVAGLLGTSIGGLALATDPGRASHLPTYPIGQSVSVQPHSLNDLSESYYQNEGSWSRRSSVRNVGYSGFFPRSNHAFEVLADAVAAAGVGTITSQAWAGYRFTAVGEAERPTDVGALVTYPMTSSNIQRTTTSGNGRSTTDVVVRDVTANTELARARIWDETLASGFAIARPNQDANVLTTAPLRVQLVPGRNYGIYVVVGSTATSPQPETEVRTVNRPIGGLFTIDAAA